MDEVGWCCPNRTRGTKDVTKGDETESWERARHDNDREGGRREQSVENRGGGGAGLQGCFPNI